MPQIGELAYKVKFDARELTRGLLSTRQQMAASQKIILGMRSPLEKYVQGLQNLSAIQARYTDVAKYANKIENELEKQYLEETKAISGLNAEQRKRLDILTQEERIAAKLQKTEESRAAQLRANRATYLAAQKQAGQQRSAWFNAIDAQATDGRSALAGRLVSFKKQKAINRKRLDEEDKARLQQQQEAREARLASAQAVGAQRQSWFSAIDTQATEARTALSKRLVDYKKKKAEEETRRKDDEDKIAAEAAKQAKVERQRRMALHRQLEESKQKAAAARDAADAKEEARQAAEQKRIEEETHRVAREARARRMALYRQLEASKQKAIRDREAREAKAAADAAAEERRELERQAKASERLAAEKRSRAESARGYLGRQALMLGSAYLGTNFLQSSVTRTADVQRNTTVLGSQLGSLERGKRLMEEFRKMSNDKSMSFDGLQESAKTMVLFGVQADRLVPTLSALAEITAGDTERMKNLSLAFGQTTAAGRLMGQELLQMVNAGFNPLQEISRTTGRSVASLRKDMEEGKVSAEMVANALITASTGTGRFAGTMERVAGTMAGALVKAQNQFDIFKLEVGKALEPAVVSLTNAFSASMPVLREYKDILGDIATVVKIVADGVSSLNAKPGAKQSGLWTGFKQGMMGMATGGLSAVRTVSDFGTAMFSNDADKMLDAGERIRSRIGPGQLSKEFNDAIDARAKARADAAAKEERAATEKANAELKLTAEKQKETDRQARVTEAMQRLQDQVDKRKFGAESVEELNVLKEATKEERNRIDALKKQIEAMEVRDKRRKELMSQFDDWREKVDPNAKLIRTLTDIQVMQGLGELTATQASKARTLAFNDTINDANKNATTIAPSLKVGSREAYQALIQAADVMKMQQSNEQKRMQLDIATIATATKDATKILEEIRDMQPGDGG